MNLPDGDNGPGRSDARQWSKIQHQSPPFAQGGILKSDGAIFRFETVFKNRRGGKQRMFPRSTAPASRALFGAAPRAERHWRSSLVCSH